MGLAGAPPQPQGALGRKGPACRTSSRAAEELWPFIHPPVLEGIAAQLIHPPFLNGSDAPSCLPPRHRLQFPGRQPLGKQWMHWSWQDCAAQHQVVGGPGVPSTPACIPPLGIERPAPLGAGPVRLSCLALLCDSFLGRGDSAAGPVPFLGPSWGSIEPLCFAGLGPERAVRWWVQERDHGGSDAAVLCP